MKRGELSMEVIIIAAIALLVLVILSVLLIRSAGDVEGGTGCESPAIGGRCTDRESACEEGYISGVNSCKGDNMKCCVPITKQQS